MNRTQARVIFMDGSVQDYKTIGNLRVGETMVSFDVGQGETIYIDRKIFGMMVTNTVEVPGGQS